jgi:hypothetical protein
MSLYLLNDMKKSRKKRIVRIGANHLDAGISMPSIRQVPKCRQDHPSQCRVRVGSEGCSVDCRNVRLNVRRQVSKLIHVTKR